MRNPSSRVSRKTSAPLPLEELTALSPTDGRYRAVSEALAAYFSEYALIKKRLVVEVEYLVALSKVPRLGVRRLTDKEVKLLLSLGEATLEDARIVKAIEKEGYQGVSATNHDVKAVEYFLKLKLKGTSLEDVTEWLHFALTSEDVNSIAY